MIINVKFSTSFTLSRNKTALTIPIELARSSNNRKAIMLLLFLASHKQNDQGFINIEEKVLIKHYKIPKYQLRQYLLVLAKEKYITFKFNQD